MATTYAAALSYLASVVDNGVLAGDSRIAARLDEAQRRLINQYNFVSHREESLETPIVYQAGGTTGDGTGNLLLDSIDATKLMVLAAFREENNQFEMADQLEKKAFGYIERDILNEVERSRYTIFSALALTDQNTFGGLVGRLGLECFTKYKMPKARLQSYVNQAYEQAVDHYNSIVGNEHLDLASITFTTMTSDATAFDTNLPAEIIRSLALAMISQNEDSEVNRASGKELSTFKQEAFALIQRNITQAVQSARFTTRKTLMETADSSTFGYHWGRIGLEVPDPLTFSDDAVKRAVNTAEEQLMLSGKWVGTVEAYTLTLTGSGEIFLPRNIETILFVSYDSNPQPVHDRFYEWMVGGPGIQFTNYDERYGFTDRGEAIDPSDSTLKRKYYVTYPSGASPTPVVSILAKKRFILHTSNSDTMVLRNYQAIAETAKSILTDGKVGNIDNAKKMLSTQTNQQFMKQKPNTAYTKRFSNFR